MKKFCILFFALIVIGKIQAQSFVAVPQKVINLDDQAMLLEVVSNGSWTAESNESWLRVSLSGGNFNSQSSTSKLTFSAASATTSLLWFTAATNTGAVNRSAIVHLSAINGNSIDITVNQQMRIPRVSAGVDTVVLQDGFAYQPITTNTNFTASSSEDWLSVSLSYFDTGNKTVSFKTASSTMTNLFFRAASNTTSSSRIGTITLKPDGGTLEFIRVIQWPSQETQTQLFISHTEVKTVNNTAGVQVISNRACTASSQTEWLKVALSGDEWAQASQTVTLHPNTHRFTYLDFYAATNTTSNERIASVLVTTDGGYQRVIYVHQYPSENILNVSASAVAIRKDIQAVIVESNSNWTAKSSQEWLKVGLSGVNFGTNTSTVHWDERTSFSVLWFSASPNTTIVGRVATITIKSDAGLEQTITVSQEAGKALIQVSTPSVSFVEKENKPITIVITANVEWIAVSDKEWIMTSVTDKRGSANLTLTTTPNTSNEARTGNIYIKSMSGDTLQVIAITQAAGAGTAAPEVHLSAISLHPNPAVNHFTINADAQIEIYSLLGELQLSKRVAADEQIGIEALARGVYIVKIQTENGTSQLKITKQ